jgi:gas vesicle protein
VRDLRNTKNVLISLLIGSLTGAAIMLLFAPQSVRQTRAQIYQRSIQLRDRTQMDRVSAALDAGKTPVEAACDHMIRIPY